MADETMLFFNRHQWDTLQAAMERIIPADDVPGAADAETIVWLDRYLSGIGYIHAKPDGSGFITLGSREAKVWSERVNRLRDIYTAGVRNLDDLGESAYGLPFVCLRNTHKDEVLRIVEALEQPGLRSSSSDRAHTDRTVMRRANEVSFDEHFASFFELLVAHTRLAFYSDPIYGGNRGGVGWRVIGFAGPRTLAEAQTGEYTTECYFNDDVRLEEWYPYDFTPT
jgi:gluconate 2-dehydrogenase gamma chain